MEQEDLPEPKPEIEKPVERLNYLQEKRRLKDEFRIQDQKKRKAEAKEYEHYQRKKGLPNLQHHLDVAEKHEIEEDIEHAQHEFDKKAEPAIEKWELKIKHRLEERKLERRTAFKNLRQESRDRRFRERRAA